MAKNKDRKFTQMDEDLITDYLSDYLTTGRTTAQVATKCKVTWHIAQDWLESMWDSKLVNYNSRTGHWTLDDHGGDEQRGQEQ